MDPVRDRTGSGMFTRDRSNLGPGRFQNLTRSKHRTRLGPNGRPRVNERQFSRPILARIHLEPVLCEQSHNGYHLLCHYLNRPYAWLQCTLVVQNSPRSLVYTKFFSTSDTCILFTCLVFISSSVLLEFFHDKIYKFGPRKRGSGVKWSSMT